MNMRMHMNRRGDIIKILSLLLLLFCSSETFCKRPISRSTEEITYNLHKLNKNTNPKVEIYPKGEKVQLLEERGEIGMGKVDLENNKEGGKDLSFATGFVESLALIFVSEFGDRTFMLTVLYSMKYRKYSVMIPGSLTMMTMHFISVAFGSLFPMVFSPLLIKYVSIFLFLFFGVKMLFEAYNLGLALDAEKEYLMNDINLSYSLCIDAEREGRIINKPLCPMFEYISLLFMADWGDRCQISAIVLTTTRNVLGVAIGGAIGMVICVVIAVIGGGYLAGRISEKTTTYIGALLFFFFAVETFLFIQILIVEINSTWKKGFDIFCIVDRLMRHWYQNINLGLVISEYLRPEEIARVLPVSKDFNKTFSHDWIWWSQYHILNQLSSFVLIDEYIIKEHGNKNKKEGGIAKNLVAKSLNLLKLNKQPLDKLQNQAITINVVYAGRLGKLKKSLTIAKHHGRYYDMMASFGKLCYFNGNLYKISVLSLPELEEGILFDEADTILVNFPHLDSEAELNDLRTINKIVIEDLQANVVIGINYSNYINKSNKLLVQLENSHIKENIIEISEFNEEFLAKLAYLIIKCSTEPKYYGKPRNKPCNCSII